jgi:D-alanyl-D-alanine carboxypeptidase
VGVEARPTAQSYIVVDANSKKVLMASQATKPRAVASLTKIATACVVLDWAEATGTSLSDWTRVPPSAGRLQPNPFGFQVNDVISIRDALCCAMMGSDNIAAETLAWHVGGDIMRRTGRGKDPFTTFVKQMNTLAEKLAMDDTKFLNPHGLDNASVVPYSTAADIARLTIYAELKPGFNFYTSQRERRVTFLKGGQTRQSFMLKNTNELVGREGINGVKTGTTQRAGQCLVLSAQKKPIVIQISKDNHQVYPRRLVVVVLASNNRFAEGRAFMNEGWARYDAWSHAGRQINDSSELLDPVAQ